MHVLVIIVNIDNMHGEKLKKKLMKKVSPKRRYLHTGSIKSKLPDFFHPHITQILGEKNITLHSTRRASCVTFKWF